MSNEDRRDVDCFVEGERVRCEVDGRQIELADQENIRETVEDVMGNTSSPEVCAALTEEWTDKHVHDEFESTKDRYVLGRSAVMRGCPIPKLSFDSEEERQEAIERAEEIHEEAMDGGL
jgi:hypothetical protein